MNILGLIWWLLFWFYMIGIIYGVYLQGGMLSGIYGGLTVLILFWWFRSVGFFRKTG